MSHGLRWSALAGALLALTSCGSIRFDVEQALGEQRVAGSPLGGVLPALLPNPLKLTIDLKAETDKRGTGPASAAFLKSLTLSATPAQMPSGTFDFLDEVHLFVEASGLPKVELATLAPVPRGVNSVAFTIVPDVDLKPYINAGATLTATATGRQPQRDFTFDGNVVVDVHI